jgi:hypothetical protein
MEYPKPRGDRAHKGMISESMSKPVLTMSGKPTVSVLIPVARPLPTGGAFSDMAYESFLGAVAFIKLGGRARAGAKAAPIRSSRYTGLKGLLTVFTMTCYGSMSHSRKFTFLYLVRAVWVLSIPLRLVAF